MVGDRRHLIKAALALLAIDPLSGVRNVGIRDGHLLELRRIEDVRDSAICLD